LIRANSKPVRATIGGSSCSWERWWVCENGDPANELVQIFQNAHPQQLGGGPFEHQNSRIPFEFTSFCPPCERTHACARPPRQLADQASLLQKSQRGPGSTQLSACLLWSPGPASSKRHIPAVQPAAGAPKLRWARRRHGETWPEGAWHRQAQETNVHWIGPCPHKCGWRPNCSVWGAQVTRQMTTVQTTPTRLCIQQYLLLHANCSPSRPTKRARLRCCLKFVVFKDSCANIIV
jgi:hypothetical protein